MSTPRFVNSEPLLAAITTEQPTGVNVHNSEDADRYNAVTRIKLRYFNNAKEWQHRYTQSRLRGQIRPVPTESQSWQTVIEHATSCLASQSKDTWVCAYYLVALVYRYGFYGLNEGLQFLTELLKLYGSQLHPAEQPLVELRQIVPNLVEALHSAPITDPAHGDRSRLDFVIAADISEFSEEQLAPYLSLGTPLTEQLRTDLAETPAQHLKDLDEVIRGSEQLLDTYDQLLRAQFPNRTDYPNHDAIRKELRACRALFAPHLESFTSVLSDVEGTSVTEGELGSKPALASGDPVRNRRDALRQLEGIADFFQGIEPLSPLPYLIRRTVAWGNMTLPEVLAELLSEEERIKLRDRAGIPLQETQNGSAS